MRRAAAPVFVVGAPFSGGNVLGWALAQLPIFEAPASDAAIDALVAVLGSLADRARPLAETGGEIAAAFPGPDRTERLAEAAVASLAPVLSEAFLLAGGRRPVVAAPAISFHVALLARLLPDARFLHVVRPVADAVAAALGSGGDSLGSTHARADAWASAAAACSDAESALGPRRILRVQHDALAAAPEGELRRILRFLGEEAAFAEEGVWPLRVLLGRPGRRLDTSERAAIGRRKALLSRRLLSMSQPRSSDPGARRRLADLARSPAPSPAPTAEERVRAVVAASVPDGCTALVVTRGDDRLLSLGGCRGRHFPSTPDGVYAGFHPANSADAVAHLEEQRRRGADALVIPHSAYWWLEHYTDFRRHLEERYRLAADGREGAVVFLLTRERGSRAPRLVLADDLALDAASGDRRAVAALLREPSLAEALAHGDPVPPRRRRRRLPGSLWAMTTFYNPAGYRNKFWNYRRFRAGLRRAGVPLLTVEVAFGEQPFELRRRDADRVVWLRGRDVLWQKERILNLGLGDLPDECDKVAWVDGDVLFMDPGWAEATARSLELHQIVQPYSHCVRLPEGDLRCDPSSLRFGPGENELFYGMAYGIAKKGRATLARYFEHGHTGFAWAARRSLLERHGLYDANLLANGDTDIAHAMFGSFEYWSLKKFGPALLEHVRRWAEPFAADVDGSVGFVEGLLVHLWHGTLRDRLYHLPLDVLHDFEPERDLAVNPETGLYEWGEASSRVREWSRDYFAARHEGGPGDQAA